MNAMCQKCGEPATDDVAITINGTPRPLVYLCYKHADAVERAITPETRVCTLCRAHIPSAKAVTHITYGNSYADYCPQCLKAWQEWEKKRQVETLPAPVAAT